jgi:hypothetical protein
MDTPRKRPVFFKVWIPAQFSQKIDEETQKPVGRKILIEGTDTYSGFDTAGFFHGWGNDAIKINEVPVPITVGIVEDRNGYVHKVLVDHIKFDV